MPSCLCQTEIVHHSIASSSCATASLASFHFVTQLHFRTSFRFAFHFAVKMRLQTASSAILALIVPSVLAAPSKAPLVKRCVNSAADRSCWSDNFDLSTNYYAEAPDTGVTREVGDFLVGLEWEMLTSCSTILSL